MSEFLNNLFTNLQAAMQWASTGQFIPHGHCYLWKPDLVGLHLFSDLLIALAYYSIPITLVYFVQKREDLPFNWIFLLFGAFIVACGTTHLMEVWTLWYPTYWLSGSLKVVTAVVSLYTAVQLVPLVPLALALPSPAQLEGANQELRNQIAERERAEKQLSQYRNHLEELVEERTQELLRVNEQLQQEIVERKQSEAALQQSEARFKRLAESNIIGVIFPDFSGRIIDANTAFLQMVGYTRQDMLAGQVRWDAMTPPEYQQQDERSLEELRAVGTCTPFEKEYICKDGSRIPVLVGAAVLEETQGNCIGFVLDLTERKRIEAERNQLLVREQEARKQAEVASRTKDEFLAIVSHELRSPLNAILGWSCLLRTRKLNEATASRALEAIERNAQAQTKLIEDLLDISRIIRGQVRLLACPTNLVQVIETAIETLRPNADAKLIQLESHLNRSVGLIFGDPDRLKQVVWNLLSNAVKFTPEGGRVAIRLERVDSQAQIKVIDTGKGISPDFLPHVFERFQQADSTTTRAYEGLGLGLAIAHNLVELHGGTVTAESPGVGQGSTFTVKLPLLETAGEAGAAGEVGGEENRPPLAIHHSQLQGSRVLVVDDEPDTRELLVTALEQYGAEVTAVASASEAMQLFERLKPDVLISDIGMPTEDGYSLIRRIRALASEQGGQIPAAALTAFAREEDGIQALSAGFQIHVSKPVEPMQLLAVVKKLLKIAND
jgi:hypothetical protein